MTTLPTLATTQDQWQWQWQQAFNGFLAEKYRRSGSLRTPAANSASSSTSLVDDGKTRTQVNSRG